MAPSTKDLAVKFCMILLDLLRVFGIPVYILDRMDALPAWLQRHIQPHRPLLVLLLIISTFFALHIMYNYYVSYQNKKKITKPERAVLLLMKQFDFAPVAVNDLRNFNFPVSDMYMLMNALLSKNLVEKANPDCADSSQTKYQLTISGREYIKNN